MKIALPILDDPLVLFKDIMILLLPLTLIGGIIFSYTESEQIRTGQIPAQTIYVQRVWVEPCGLVATCYYAATESKSMRLQPGVWFGDVTDRDLFGQAQPGANCAVITSNTIRQIQPGTCEN